MKKQQEFAAKTIDAAIESGLKALGVTSDQVDIEVLAKGGLFTKAKVRITVKETPGEVAREFLEELLGLLKVPAMVDLQETADESVLNIVASDAGNLGVLFGRHGEIIDALQYLSSLVANTEEGGYRRIVIDSENYREERRKRLEHLADDKAAKAVAEGHRVRLDPMNPYERRVIHTHLQSNPDVTTHSEGEEPLRYLVIVPNNERPRRDRGDRRHGDRNGHGERRDGAYGDRRHDRNGHGDRGRGGYGRDRRPSGEKPQRTQSTFIGTIVTPAPAPKSDDEE